MNECAGVFVDVWALRACHVTHVNMSCHMLVMSHMWICYVTGVFVDVWALHVSYVTHVNMICWQNICYVNITLVMSHMWTCYSHIHFIFSHVTQEMNRHVTQKWNEYVNMLCWHNICCVNITLVMYIHTWLMTNVIFTQHTWEYGMSIWHVYMGIWHVYMVHMGIWHVKYMKGIWHVHMGIWHVKYMKEFEVTHVNKSCHI